jgi:PKD repeat protein
VTLRVSDAQGKSSSTQKPVSVGSTAQSIAAAFTFSPTAPVAGDEVRFSDQSAGPVQQWLWNFGDGTTSTERNPTRRFSNPGAFEVALTVTNGAEISTATATVYVAVGSGVTPAVEASFEMSTLWPASGREIRFFDRSSGPPRSWSWDFGDGGGSTLPNPTHVFAKPGTYTVTLRAGNDASSSVQERTIIVDEDAQRRQALLPVAALTQGAGSSFWRTELTLANASSVAINVDFLFLSGATPLHKSDIIGAGESKVYENALRDLFRVSAGSGALIVEATAKGAQPDLRVSSRTFTTGSNGTYGQHVPSASTDPSTTLFIPGLEVSADFRTNLGLVNHGNVEARVNLELFDAEGRSVGKTTRTLAGGAFVQERLQTFFDLQEGSALLFRLQSETAHNVVAYASIIDNRTEDPIFVPAKQTSANAELIIPAVARAEGANRTFWRSDITLFNPTTVPMAVSLKLLDGARPEKALMIPRDTTMVIRDVMSWLGEEAVRGPLRITATGTALAPIVFSRTYTTQEGGGGTYGQWIDAIDRTRLRPVSYIVGLRSDESFRTNVGLINVGEGPATATISLLNSAGDVATVYETIPAGGAIQKDVRAFFPSAEGAFSLRLEGSGGLFAYGSVIDNLSGDPVYIAGD